MKIDFKKLKRIEQGCPNSPVCQNTLQTMIDIVLRNVSDEVAGVNTSQSYLLAFKTLVELGIIVEDDKKSEVQQLNS
jgi:uncharacterized protein YutE (UPF0331/DUF86 family)